jgi:hypothetical protein
LKSALKTQNSKWRNALPVLVVMYHMLLKILKQSTILTRTSNGSGEEDTNLIAN